MTSGNFDGDTLKVYFDRIVNLEKDKRAEAANYTADIKAVYGEAKEAGFSTSILRGIVAEQLKPQPSQEDLDLKQIYKEALGLTPLEQAAEEAAEKEQAPESKQSGAKKDAETNVAEEVDAALAPEAARAQEIVDRIGKKRVALVPAEGGFKIDRAEGARGSMGKLMDLVHDALIDAGFSHHSGGVYRAAGDPPSPDKSAGQGG